jgi:predicted AlkP superfamily pyrophosphatase or phosphodiesterase
MLFWQQSMGESADVVLTPAPIHKHHGGMIQDCYSQPPGLYHTLRKKTGGAFNLMHYWGPLASPRSSAWITKATAALLSDRDSAPELCFTYLPALDYDLQRYGLEHPRSLKALRELEQQLEILLKSASVNGYEAVIFGDYALGNVTGEPVYPNRELYRKGLLRMREVGGKLYPDFYTSAAFAMVDHEVAHLFVMQKERLPEVRKVIENLHGVGQVFDVEQQAEIGMQHHNSGDFVLLAEEGRWMAYPWWRDKSYAPDYASHVDIHNKPGYDPAELFFGWPPGSVSLNAARVRGTHGRVGAGREVAWGSTFMDGDFGSLIDLAQALKQELE